MRLTVTGAAALNILLLYGCSTKPGADPARAAIAIQSVFTDLGAPACKQEIDKTDPNETPYLTCPGVAGYSLIVRRVDAGRQSIDVVDAAQHVRPLNYQEVVTRHMCNLDGQAEWRVATKDGKQVPIALIVRVHAREDNEDPEKVTDSYLTVAKITPETACVTNRITEGSQTQAQVRAAADAALDRPCAPPQPPMTAGGQIIR